MCNSDAHDDVSIQPGIEIACCTDKHESKCHTTVKHIGALIIKIRFGGHSTDYQL